MKSRLKNTRTSILALLAVACATNRPAGSSTHSGTVKPIESMSDSKFAAKRQLLKKFVTRSGDLKVEYYLAEAGKEKPLIVYILGSGCMSQMEHFRDAPGILADAFSESANIVLVEKPGIVEHSHNMGTAVGCTDEFKQKFTVDTWVKFHLATYQDLLKSHHLHPSKILVMGHSEGAGIAAHIATTTIPVTHVALLGARGTNQLFDFLQNAGDDNVKYEAEISKWHDILADPHSIEKSYGGHPYNYWSSFLPHSALDFILRTNAEVFIAQGTEDHGANLESLSLLVSSLEAKGKHPHYERILGADHSFGRQGETDGFQKMLTSVGKWFLE